MRTMSKKTKKKTSESVGFREGFRSGLEDINSELLEEQGIPVLYEKARLDYLKPARVSRYTPDFVLPNGIIIETKGRFVTADRQKHLLISDQHPDLDVRFVFSNPRNRISKKSKTTYQMWCEKNDFLFAAKLIPDEWIKEPPTEKRLAALEAAFGSAFFEIKPYLKELI